MAGFSAQSLSKLESRYLLGCGSPPGYYGQPSSLTVEERISSSALHVAFLAFFILNLALMDRVLLMLPISLTSFYIFKGLRDYSGPNQVIQDNLSLFKFYLLVTLITISKSLLLCKVIYSQPWELECLFFWGLLFSL